jgi:hypothetical protein
VAAPDYDGVLKDLFQKDPSTILKDLAAGAAIQEVLSGDFQEMQQRRADLVLRLADQSILNIEFQSENHKDVPYRVGIYGLMMGQRYRVPVRQVVLYVGQKRLSMEDSLDIGSVQVRYRLVDIRAFQAEDLLRSGKPGDLALAVLASGGTEKLAEIVRCAAQLAPPARNRALTQLTLLSGLRRLSGKFRMEVRRMGLMIDLRENVILREWYDEAVAKGRSEGRTEGVTEGSSRVVRELLQAKFGPLPAAVQQLLARASTSDVERWAIRILKADTLDAVFADE